MLTIRLDFKSPAPGVVKDVFKVLRNMELFALLLACFLMGEHKNKVNVPILALKLISKYHLLSKLKI